MRHFVQYHNVEKRGRGNVNAAPPAIFSKRHALVGDRIWLISGEGKPRRYTLNGSFEVARVRSDARRAVNIFEGSTERWFLQPVPIDSEPWLETVKRITGNFAFGLQRIKDADIIQSLVDLSLPSHVNAGEDSSDRPGKTWGSPDHNRLVEVAAVKAVRKKYRNDGWKVSSHESKRLGYDLHCSKSEFVHHVEVKGTSGTNCAFVVTANECEFARKRQTFRLCVVTSALDRKLQKITTFNSAQFASNFEFEPLAFSARLRT